MDRIKRISFEVLDEHKSKFGEDFADNKKILDEVSIIRSKSLKNKTAGYITKFIKKEIREEKEKQARIASSQSEEPMEKEVQVDIPEQITAEETSTETIVETTPVKETAETIEDSVPFIAIKIFSVSRSGVSVGFNFNNKSSSS